MHIILVLYLSLGHAASSVQAAMDSVVRFDSISASSTLLVPYRNEIDSVADESGLPPALLAGVIQEESLFDEWATRVEPAYLVNEKIMRAARSWSQAHRGIPNIVTELADRSRSYGLMQVMGETAREQGFGDRYLAALYLPRNSLEQGAKLLRRLLTRYPGDTLSVISAYNQGTARKRSGVFENARYVYRVTIAWRAYNTIFRRDR